MLQKQGKKWRKKADRENGSHIFLQNTSMCTYQSGIQCKPLMPQSYSTVPFDLVRCWRNVCHLFFLGHELSFSYHQKFRPYKRYLIGINIAIFLSNLYEVQLVWLVPTNKWGRVTHTTWLIVKLNLYVSTLKDNSQILIGKVGKCFFFSFSPLTFDIFYWNRKVSLSKC